jgi:hypothetical protein
LQVAATGVACHPPVALACVCGVCHVWHTYRGGEATTPQLTTTLCAVRLTRAMLVLHPAHAAGYHRLASHCFDPKQL